MNITFGNQELVLHHAGVLFWPEQSILAVSDLHLEKGSSFAKYGFFLPPYDSDDTLMRLLAVCATFTPKRLLLLGDSFHDAQGYERLSPQTRDLFQELRHFQPIWIRGNHDQDFVPDGFEAHDTFSMNGLNFVHEATKDGIHEISGHFHPKVDMIHKGMRLSSRCFLNTGHKLIMPSFGSYTGGLSVTSSPVRHFFKGSSATGHVLGQSRIYNIPIKS